MIRAKSDNVVYSRHSQIQKCAKNQIKSTHPKTPTATAASLRARPCSISIRASGLIVAVFLGCRSFCTAETRQSTQNASLAKHSQNHNQETSHPEVSLISLTTLYYTHVMFTELLLAHTRPSQKVHTHKLDLRGKLFVSMHMRFEWEPRRCGNCEYKHEI